MEERLRIGGLDARVARLQPWKVWLLVVVLRWYVRLMH